MSLPSTSLQRSFFLKCLFYSVFIFMCLMIVCDASAKIKSKAAIINITTCAGLQNISTDLIDQYVLANDIDCSGVDFSPIGTTQAPFVGSLNGAGHTIKHLSINKSANDNIGLFGVTNKADVEQLTLEDVAVVGNNQVGALIGSANNGTAISKVQVHGNVTTAGQSGQNIGGLIGSMSGKSTVNASATSTVVSTLLSAIQMGGLIGYLNDSSITHSYAMGPVSGSSSIGGLIGYMVNGSVTDSSATGTVNATNGNVGGLVGSMGSSASVIRNYATGTVNGTGSTGGLIGYSSGNIVDSYATGKVIGTSSVGGLVGYNNATIKNTYSTGVVSGTSDTGGLIGIGSALLVTNSYWDTQTSGRTTSAGGTGKTTADMYQQSTYAGWDFTNTWNIHPGSSYPWLRSTDQEIKTCAQLQEMSQNLSASFRLITNVDCSGVTFSPVGNDQQPFTGSLDGSGYVISSLNIAKADAAYIGLFGATQGAYVTNLVLKNVQIIGQKAVGALIGYASGNTQISGVSADGLVQARSVGMSDIGGLIGVLSEGSINHSAAAITVDAASANNVGGLIGQNNGLVWNSYALGDISGSSHVGGLVGDNQGTLNNNYAAGKVSGASNTGGLIGSGNGNTVASSYWDTQTSGQSTSVGGVGKTTAEMHKQNTYVGWDFNNIWDIYDGYTYPWLRDQMGKELVTKLK